MIDMNGSSKNNRLLSLFISAWGLIPCLMLCEETSFVEHLLNSVTRRARPESSYQRDFKSENHHISVINGHLSGWGRCWFINRWYLFDVSPGTGASWQHGTPERAEPAIAFEARRTRASITPPRVWLMALSGAFTFVYSNISI